MPPELDTWPRPYFEQGGWAPFLFYVVFGEISLGIPLVSEFYRSHGVPAGLRMGEFDLNSSGAVLDRYRKGPVWDEFETSHPDLAEEVTWCEQCVVLRGVPEESETLDYLRDIVGMVSYLFDQGGCAVYDVQAHRWWTPDAWKHELFDPAEAVPRRHIVMQATEDELPGSKWYHTHGMRKFGRPDISIHNVTEPVEPDIIDLCKQLITVQALGAVIRNGHSITINSIYAKVTFTYAGGLNDPEFNNFRLEVRVDSPADVE